MVSGGQGEGAVGRVRAGTALMVRVIVKLGGRRAGWLPFAVSEWWGLVLRCGLVEGTRWK